jgi:ABC-2 type transport system permease protein
MSGRRILGAYVREWWTEVLRALRTPGFAIPFLVMPTPIYLFFGVVLAGDAVAARPGLAGYLFSGWLVFAAMMPGIFGVGCGLAIERDAGLHRLKRALPAPPGAVVIAKMGMALAIAAVAMVILVVTATLSGTIALAPRQVAGMLAVIVAGTVPFSAIGLFIGTHVSGSASPAVANVVFLPMLWLSGLFIPLPKFLEPWVIVWPAFHLNQLSIAAAGLGEFRFIPPGVALAVLAGVTVLFGGLAIRRLAERG